MRVVYSKFTPNLKTAKDVCLDIGDHVLVKGRSCLRECIIVQEYCRDAGDTSCGYHVSYVELPHIELFVNEESILWWTGKPELPMTATPLTTADKEAVEERAKEGRYAKIINLKSK